jgi:hypothetical protein
MLQFGLAVLGLLASLVVALLWLRRRRGPGISLENSAATTWLNFRRLVAFLFAFLLVGGSIYNFNKAIEEKNILPLVIALATDGFALVLVLFGIYGGAPKRGGYWEAIDKEQTLLDHKRRKRKYGWRW